MSTRFDDEVQASWGRLEAQRCEALADIGDRSLSIELEGEAVLGPQRAWTLDQVAEQLDDLAGDAAAQVGGTLWEAA